MLWARGNIYIFCRVSTYIDILNCTLKTNHITKDKKISENALWNARFPNWGQMVEGRFGQYDQKLHENCTANAFWANSSGVGVGVGRQAKFVSSGGGSPQSLHHTKHTLDETLEWISGKFANTQSKNQALGIL